MFVRGGFSHERKIIDFIIIITDVFFLSPMSVISLMTRMSVRTLGVSDVHDVIGDLCWWCVIFLFSLMSLNLMSVMYALQTCFNS
jgi:hypothetical protein